MAMAINSVFFSVLNLDPTLQLVASGTVLIAVSASVVGCFAFLRKRSLVGDAIAHAVLPGVAIAFMLTTSKSPLVLMAGALLSGWLAMFCINYIKQKTKLSADTAIALILSVFFGVGILLLTHIQHSNAGNQSGLDRFLFGNAASMNQQDLIAYAGVALLLLLAIAGFYKELKLVSFNPDFAQAAGLPVKFLNRLLSSLTVLAISIGIQSVGVVLMAALLITPAATARNWTNRLGSMLFLASFFGAISALVGALVSFSAPAMPTGPWIVMTLSLLALASILGAPQKGLWARYHRQKANRQKIRCENVLKAFYKHEENGGDKTAPVNQKVLQKIRHFEPAELNRGLALLQKRHLIIPKQTGFILSRKGRKEGARVVRLHRLWEMYLSQRMRMKTDHIHPNAETIEHLITPEIEAMLLKELDYPEKDPHSSPIPYAQ
jgi:manganese/zinc/iron transport system permease protein